MTHPAGSEFDAILVRAAARGDAPAWKHLLDANSDRVANYARWRCAGLHDLAADVIQQTWLEAARSLHRYDPARGVFSDWIGGIVRRVILVELRKRRRYRHRSLTDQPESSAAQADPDRAEAVVRALAELPEEYEAVLRAKYLEGLGVQTIAEANGESSKAVESRLTRARDAFREVYRRLTGEGT